MTTPHNMKTKGTQLLNLLASSGHKEKIRIEFSGSGDSGGIDYITGLARGHALYQEVHDWADDFAGELPNWWDNDGGSGWIELDVEAQQIHYSVDQNHMESETVQSGTISTDGTETELQEE